MCSSEQAFVAMRCIYCGNNTAVTNSRLQKRANHIWRRRHCKDCGATFTTEERPQYELSWTVKTKTGSHEPFSRDKLLLSLYRSLQHRKSALYDAGELTQTVMDRLRAGIADGRIDGRAIAETAQVALNRFDKVAGTHYIAFHNQLY